MNQKSSTPVSKGQKIKTPEIQLPPESEEGGDVKMIPSAKDGAEATEGLIEVDEKLLQEPLRSPSAYEVLSSASSTKSSRASTFSKETAGHIDSGICGLVLDQKGGESPRSCHRTCCQQRHDIASEVRIERAERAGKTYIPRPQGTTTARNSPARRYMPEILIRSTSPISKLPPGRVKNLRTSSISFQDCRPFFKLSHSTTTTAIIHTQGFPEFSYSPYNTALTYTFRVLLALEDQDDYPPISNQVSQTQPPLNVHFCSVCLKPLIGAAPMDSISFRGGNRCTTCRDMRVRKSPKRKHPIPATISSEYWRHELLWRDDMTFLSAGEGFRARPTMEMNVDRGKSLRADYWNAQTDGTTDDYGVVIDGQYILYEKPKVGMYCAECGKGKGVCCCYEELRTETCMICTKRKEECTCWDRSTDRHMFLRDEYGRPKPRSKGSIGGAHLVMDGISLRGGLDRRMKVRSNEQKVLPEERKKRAKLG